MSIPDSQLGTWSHVGATTMSSKTYASIKACLEADGTSYACRSFEVFLQGSYGNDTNIRADSDVDIIMMLTSIFRSDINQLPADQAAAYRGAFPDATYSLSEFKNGVISQLHNVYGNQSVRVGNKSIKVGASSNRLGADVVVCYQYRYYRYFRSPDDQVYDEGIIFFSSLGDEIINYPKLHSRNCTAKHQNTNKSFKPAVRLFKNMRSRLISDGKINESLAPSYFIEGLLYNVPDNQFRNDFSDTFCNCVNWLLKTNLSGLICPNGKHLLFGSSSVQWDMSRCSQFLNALASLWNSW